MSEIIAPPPPPFCPHGCSLRSGKVRRLHFTELHRGRDIPIEETWSCSGPCAGYWYPGEVISKITGHYLGGKPGDTPTEVWAARFRKPGFEQELLLALCQLERENLPLGEFTRLEHSLFEIVNKVFLDITPLDWVRPLPNILGSKVMFLIRRGLVHREYNPGPVYRVTEAGLVAGDKESK